MDRTWKKKGYGTQVPEDPETQAPATSRCRLSQETKSDVKEILKLSFTIAAVNLASNAVSPISIMFIGQLGVVPLDGVNLASTLINCTGFAVSGGMTSACDTLIAQAKGSNNRRQVGIYLQQSLMIIMLFVLPIWAIHLNAESLLRLMGQDPEVCRVAGDYLTMTIPAMFFLLLYRILFSYLRSIGYLTIPLLAGVIGTGVNILLHYLLVIQFPIGIAGSAIAQDCSYLIMFLITAGMLFKSKVYRAYWDGWTMEAFQHWGPFIYIGMAGFGIWFLEFLGGEMGAILSGLLGTIELGAQSVLFSYYLLVYSLPFGFGIGCNVRVAQLLGSGDGKRARKNAIMAVVINAACAVGLIIFTLALASEIPKVFSSDKAVVDYTTSVFPVLCIHLLMDCPLIVSSGVLRGCGRHGTGVLVLLTGYFIIACPLSIVLMLVVRIGVAGFWASTAIGLFTTNLCATIYLFCCLNWDKAAEKARRSDSVISSNESELERKDSDANQDLEETGEAIGLLTYKDLAKHKTEARWRRFHMANARAFSGSPRSGMDAGEIVKVHEDPAKLYGYTLFWRRAGFIIFMFLVLTVAVLTRIFLTPNITKPMTDLCIPFNSSITNSSLPFCNATIPIVNVTVI